MESFKPQHNNEKNDAAFNKHKSFFSTENFKKSAGNSMIVTGTVLALTGIYEALSGEKIGHLLSDYKDHIPSAINWVIAHVDAIPTFRKTGGGSSLITAGLILDGYFDELWSKDNGEK